MEASPPRGQALHHTRMPWGVISLPGRRCEQQKVPWFCPFPAAGCLVPGARGDSQTGKEGKVACALDALPPPCTRISYGTPQRVCGGTEPRAWCTRGNLKGFCNAAVSTRMECAQLRQLFSFHSLAWVPPTVSPKDSMPGVRTNGRLDELEQHDWSQRNP